MEPRDTVATLCDHAGVSLRGVSDALGKSREYARQAAMAKRGPLLSTVADVADVCGCDVVLVDRSTGERVGVVDPPRRGGASD